MRPFSPYAYKETGMGGLGSGVGSLAFYDLIGNAWFAYTPAYLVGRSVAVTSPAEGHAAQSYFQASVLPASLGVGSLGLTPLTGHAQAPANNSVGSP